MSFKLGDKDREEKWKEKCGNVEMWKWRRWNWGSGFQ